MDLCVLLCAYLVLSVLVISNDTIISKNKLPINVNITDPGMTPGVGQPAFTAAMGMLPYQSQNPE